MILLTRDALTCQTWRSRERKAKARKCSKAASRLLYLLSKELARPSIAHDGNVVRLRIQAPRQQLGNMIGNSKQNALHSYERHDDRGKDPTVLDLSENA